MAGNTEGGRKAAATVKKRHGEDFYRNIGKLGGTARTENVKNRGFASIDKDSHINSASLGGKKSKRTKKKPVESLENTPH